MKFKKILMGVVAILMLTSLCYAAPQRVHILGTDEALAEVRDKGLLVTPQAKEATTLYYDTIVSGSPVVVYAISVTFTGATGGIRLWNDSVAANGILYSVNAAASRAVYSFCPSVGMEFNSALFYDVNLSTGTATINLVYELNP